jgi:hypothetical protein
LIGRVEAEEDVDARERVAYRQTAINAVLDLDNSEQAVERALEREDLLHIRALRRERLHE